MNYKKFLVIGGSRGIGRDIAVHFKGDSFSRLNGYDIKKPDSRKKIALSSLNYDVVLNHAYCGDFNQTLMLQELCSLWTQKEKKGYIINTGSMCSYRFNDGKNEKWWLMSAVKTGQDLYINYLSQGSAWRENIKFRITNIRPGMLDTEEGRRKKEHFKAGIRGKDYCRLIEYLLSTPEDLIISEVTLEARYNV